MQQLQHLRHARRGARCVSKRGFHRRFRPSARCGTHRGVAATPRPSVAASRRRAGEARTSGRRVQMPELRGRKSLPTTASSTLLLPALWPPTATTCGSVSHSPGSWPGLPPTTLLSPAIAQAFCSRFTSSSKRLSCDIVAPVCAQRGAEEARARGAATRVVARAKKNERLGSLTERGSETRWCAAAAHRRRV